MVNCAKRGTFIMRKRSTQIDDTITRARAAGRAALNDPLRAVHAFYDEDRNAVGFELKSGVSIEMPVRSLEEIRGVPKQALRSVTLTPAGDALTWNDLDVHISVSGLLHQAFSPALRKELGRRGGHAISAKKAAAARTNGAKGGRPKKRVEV